MKVRNIILTAMLLAAGLLSSCGKSSLETTYNNQEAKIDSYISSLTATDTTLRVVHNAGSHRIVLKEGTGAELTDKGTVAIYYAGYTFTSGISAAALFATNNQEVAESIDWGDLGGFSYEVKLLDMKEADLLKGLYNGLKGVKTGEECIILFSGKYAFGSKALGTIPANSALAYYVWVESLNND